MSGFNTNDLWDLSLPPTLPSLGDDDFLALLQKQFSATPDDNANKAPEANINPQALSLYPAPQNVSPPLSEDSSPSPPSYNDATSNSRRQSGLFGDRDSEDPQDEDSMLKRKASDEDMGDEPEHKSQHTSSSKKTSSSARRKSSGATTTHKDESRLLKRKEQNRAAQRAFRERKEKHVKDLEEKVAALEQKNQSAVSENENLREVISRLQSENLRLRETSFTFSMPNTASTSNAGARTTPSGNSPTSTVQESPLNLFGNVPSSSSSTTASSHDSPQSLFLNDKPDTPATSLFGGSTVYSMLPEEPQRTATGDAMSLDFGFGSFGNEGFTHIASNPLFMSFREGASESSMPATSNIPHTNSSSSFDFGTQSLNAWPDMQMQSFDLSNSLDELFGNGFSNGTAMDFNNFGKSPANSISPVSHHSASRHNSAASAPSLSPVSTTQSANEDGACGEKCPRSKEELAQVIAQDRGSIFTQLQTQASLDKSALKCGTLPKTEKSDKNIEVFTAFHAIANNPHFKGVDINELCSEFASKARCDGTNVVIEPSGMSCILESVTKKTQQQQQQQQLQL